MAAAASPARSNIVHPAGASTGCRTLWTTPPSFTTCTSAATNAVKRHSTPNRSEVSTMRRSNSRSGDGSVA
jgi:hypothetical protein